MTIHNHHLILFLWNKSNNDSPLVDRYHHPILFFWNTSNTDRGKCQEGDLNNTFTSACKIQDKLLSPTLDHFHEWNSNEGSAYMQIYYSYYIMYLNVHYLFLQTSLFPNNQSLICYCMQDTLLTWSFSISRHRISQPTRHWNISVAIPNDPTQKSETVPWKLLHISVEYLSILKVLCWKKSVDRDSYFIARIWTIPSWATLVKANKLETRVCMDWTKSK